MNYNLMCAIIVLVSSVNFLVDPKVVPGRAGVLVTLFLVLTNFFCNAQVMWILEYQWHKTLILIKMFVHFMSFDTHIGWGKRIHCCIYLHYGLHDIHCTCYDVLWIDFVRTEDYFEDKWWELGIQGTWKNSTFKFSHQIWSIHANHICIAFLPFQCILFFELHTVFFISIKFINKLVFRPEKKQQL